MTARNDIPLWRRVLEELVGPQARRVRLLTCALAELAAERDQFRDSALMYAAMVADRNSERDRLRAVVEEVARRSVQRDLSSMAKAVLADTGEAGDG